MMKALNQLMLGLDPYFTPFWTEYTQLILSDAFAQAPTRYQYQRLTWRSRRWPPPYLNFCHPLNNSYSVYDLLWFPVPEPRVATTDASYRAGPGHVVHYPKFLTSKMLNWIRITTGTRSLMTIMKKLRRLSNKMNRRITRVHRRYTGNVSGRRLILAPEMTMNNDE